MVEGQDIESSNSMFGNFLDSIDRFSKKIESSIHGNNDTTKVNNTPINIVEKTDINTPKVESQTVKKEIVEDKSSEIIDFLENTGAKISSSFKRLFYNLQYIIPAIIIFQSALWIAYLSKDSVSNGFISTFVDGLGDLGENILRLFSFFGWIIASTISSGLDSQTSFGTFSLHHNVADLIFISLFISSMLYVMKKIQSLYILIFVFLFSFILRLIEVEDFSYDWLIFSSIIISSIILTSLLSIPLSRYRYKKQLRESIIDISVISDKSQSAEASYRTPTPARIGSFMDQAPVTKPRRPSRRSEYELYEWVLLLANLILWPAVFIISLILGSGVEVYGNSYNMDENYLMLVGPLFLTLFFFGILFKMDKNARDGSLYAAEKQSYLEEMEKYLKARTAYLELVTLQAESKKQEIVEGGSEE
ncbi:hypothetical protein OAJ29_01305 [Euryarchaeota archaeon]|nr:hypothetical protein [Euryarchaeota archaeon]